MENNEELTLWCGNLSPEVEEDILHELFSQVAPLNKVQIMSQGKAGKPTNYAFITVKHQVSVDYVANIMRGIKLYGKPLILRARTGNRGNEEHRNNYNNGAQYQNNSTNELSPLKNVNELNACNNLDSDSMIDQLYNMGPQLNVTPNDYGSPQAGFDLRNQIEEHRNYNDRNSRYHDDKYRGSREHEGQDDYRGRNNDYRHKDGFRGRNEYNRNDRRDDYRNNRGRNDDQRRGNHQRHGGNKPYYRR